MIYGYARVSSKGQKQNGTSLEEQRDTFLERGIPEENIFVESYTGTKMNRPQFDLLLSVLQPGDELVVTKLDRFARTAPEGAATVRDLVARGVKVNVLNMGVADNSPMGKVMVSVLLAFAEFERDMIAERTTAGREYKREHDPNYREGRKAIEIPQFDDYLQRVRAGELTVAECCAALGISRNTWYRRAKETDAA